MSLASVWTYFLTLLLLSDLRHLILLSAAYVYDVLHIGSKKASPWDGGVAQRPTYGADDTKEVVLSYSTYT